MDVWTPAYVQVASMFDAETCPDPVPDHYDACMVYAGGSSAAHAWSEAELARVAHLPRLPVWVPTPGHEGALAAADAFLAWLTEHGVPGRAHAQDRPVHVMWDMETGKEPDAAWLDKAADHLAKHGYWNLVYGSTSTLFGQPARDGYVVANPTGQPHMFQRAHVRATQYAFDVHVPGGIIDQTLITRELVNQLWTPAQ